MKSMTKLSIVLSLALTIQTSHAQWGQEKIVGNGNITTKNVTTASYDEIKLVGSMDVHLVSGTEGSISVTTDDNIHEYLEIEVNDNKLIIKAKKNYYFKTKDGIHVTVPFVDISEVTLVGSGDIDSKNIIKTNNFEVNVTGSGNIHLEIDAAKTDAKVTGSGDLKLYGKTNELDVVVTGSGNFRGYDLVSAITDVKVNGSGDAEVYAKQSLKARVSGSGDISYAGNPETRDTKTSGSGDISSH